MLVYDEVLGLELSNFSRQLRIKPGVNVDHQEMVEMSSVQWFREMEVDEEEKPKKAERQRNESSLGSYGFANETGVK